MPSVPDLELRFITIHSSRIQLDTQIFLFLLVSKFQFFRRVKDLKCAPLTVEYCAYMVAIMMTRYVIALEKRLIQQTPEEIAAKLNSLEFGQKGNFFVTTVALHHGIYIFKRILESVG